MATSVMLRIWRGDAEDGALGEYTTTAEEGEVVLDVILRIQASQAQDLAVRWNCKAGKCGSCSMEVNGHPKLACMTRLSDYYPTETITVQPLRTFPIIKDLVCDVSWNFEQNKRIKKFKPRPRDKDGEHRMHQADIDRIQEFRKCIECFLCQDVCHILRDHEKRQEFVGPRFMIRVAALEMHPLDIEDRIPQLHDELGSGYCNITRCCVEVCPEHINITDNGIIPLKERVVDRYYDPVAMLMRKIRGEDPAKSRAEG